MAQMVNELRADLLIVSEPANHYSHDKMGYFRMDCKATVGTLEHSTLNQQRVYLQAILSQADRLQLLFQIQRHGPKIPSLPV